MMGMGIGRFSLTPQLPHLIGEGQIDLTGALVIVTGMVMGNIADYFHLPVSSMSNTFTFLNAGILISIFLNAWLMEIVPLKTQLRFGFILMVLAVAGSKLKASSWRGCLW